jgi:hypothetical protein
MVAIVGFYLVLGELGISNAVLDLAVPELKLYLVEEIRGSLFVILPVASRETALSWYCTSTG